MYLDREACANQSSKAVNKPNTITEEGNLLWISFSTGQGLTTPNTQKKKLAKSNNKKVFTKINQVKSVLLILNKYNHNACLKEKNDII